MGYKEDLKAAQDRLNEAKKAHNAAVKKAEQAERGARKDYDKRVANAQKALNLAGRAWDTPIDSMGNLKLYPNRIVGPNLTLFLTDATTAQVDLSGGLLKKRKVYITVTGDDGQIVEEYDSDDEKAAREFAAKVINQSKLAKSAVERHEAETAELRASLQNAKDDTTAINAAVAAVQAAKDDTSAIDEATRLLEEVKASATEEDLAEVKAQEEQARKRKMIIGGVGAALALLVVLFSTHTICFHKWQEATCTEPETCSVCGRTRGEALGHSWVEATCTKPKTCELCGEESGEALGHQVDEWKTTKQATCTSEGERKGTCKRCGEVQTKSTKMKDHEFGEWATTKEASCTEAGERTRKCVNCDKKETEAIAKLDHTPGDWEIAIAAKVSSDGKLSDGVRVRKCTVCGTELDRETYKLDVTMGQRNALAKAASYLSFTSFSFSGLVEQLEFEGFSHEDAVFAVENCGADWNEQAAKKAQSYLDFMSFSREGLIEQLEFEGFSREQAEYGVSAVGY